MKLDTDNDLWRVYNVVQENGITGELAGAHDNQ
jgi:hypothetical protein